MSQPKKTYDQLKAIWALAHELNLSPEQLRTMVQEIYTETQGHLSSLTQDQATKIIEILKQKAGQSEPGPAPQKYGRLPRNEPRPYMSPAQSAFMFSLARQIIKKKMQQGEYDGEYKIKNRDDFEWAIKNLLHNISWKIGRVPYDEANTRQAAQIIEALKAMRERLFLKDTSSPLTK